MTRRQAVSSASAPAALGPYSQAITVGGFVFCSGTVGVDPSSGLVAEGIGAETEQALRNLAAILHEAGASMADLVKTTIFYASVTISRSSTTCMRATCLNRPLRVPPPRTFGFRAGS